MRAMFQHQTELLREEAERAFSTLETIIGWGQGFNPLRTTPLFVRRQEEISQLIWSPFCVQNLTGYLVKAPAVRPKDPSKKIGLCVRGCDSRSLIALLQESFVTRETLFIIGIPCAGTVDWRKVTSRLGSTEVRSVQYEREVLIVHDGHAHHEIPLDEVLARRCLRCRHPNPLIADVVIGDVVTPRVTTEGAYRAVESLEEKSLGERLSFWQELLDRCLRCYACRNACPLCVCQDRCIAETRNPKWLSQRATLKEKMLFHCIHAIHLAGRCTECGECERVCPVEIPVTLMKEKLCQIVRELVDYEAGVDPSAIPPLLTFNPHETGL